MKVKSRSLNKKEKEFVATVSEYYKAYGRHDLPWRKTTNPYHILVSELMLQQTQVARVIPKYKEFLKLFPSARRLAAAPLGDVLKVWQGLGYNRRAKFLWQTAQAVTSDHRGKWPDSLDELKKLPGVGVYTAGAVMNFAYNKPVSLIETNIRTVYIYHFFHDRKNVSDSDLFSLIEETLDSKNPREWNWALMDYGAYLKQTVGNASTRSSSYKKQSPFKESNRFVRGQILKTLVEAPCTKKGLFQKLTNIEPERIIFQLEKLVEESLLTKQGQLYRLP